VELTLRLELGQPVHCRDGAFGELADVVIDPARRRVTHLVVEPHHRHSLARLVAAELATPADGDDPVIRLHCTADELHGLPAVQDFAYLRFGELPVADPDWDVGIESVLVAPYFDAIGFGGGPLDLDPRVALIYDRIPKGEIEIRRASAVFSADGHRIGHVNGFVVAPDEGIADVVVERRHLVRRREIAVPIGAVARLATDSVTLDLTKRQVDRLPLARVDSGKVRLVPRWEPPSRRAVAAPR
jgi:sporulation protein YlmC with PRC-barrel domain